MSQLLPDRLSSSALSAFGLTTALASLTLFGGCRGKAHSDVYRQKMASEIRVLEDQLYAADYENRVLREKLERQRQRSSSDPSSRRTSPARNSGDPTPPSTSIRPSESEVVPTPSELELFPDMDELELPEVAPGTPAPLTDPLGERESRPPSESDPSTDELDLPGGQRILPAPGGPEPPGRTDTDMNEVIPGEILPPPASPEDSKPPGQIQLPDSVQAGKNVPSGLRIHQTLSGGHRNGEEIDGLMVVVHVIDQLGQTVDVSHFDIDGELSIVVLDPEREPDEARLGRWDFKGSQIASMVSNHPISGLHVPLRWQDDSPLGDEVIVHVRLRGEEDEMRCERRISVESTPAVARWTPRGEAIK